MTYRQSLEQESKEEGIVIGVLEGVKQGIEIGKEIGKQQVAGSLLLKLKLDIDSVQQATGLPRAELEKILQ
jgi:predicted transposase YdaD